VSPDPGRIPDERRADLLEMYRTAIDYLDSLQDPAVRPLRRELTALERRLIDEQARTRRRAEPKH
jgi:hypothetical protein